MGCVLKLRIWRLGQFSWGASHSPIIQLVPIKSLELQRRSGQKDAEVSEASHSPIIQLVPIKSLELQRRSGQKDDEVSEIGQWSRS